MSSQVLDIGEREEAITIVHCATKRLRQIFKYIDRKLEKEEPGFHEFQKTWRAAKSLTQKVSPHPSREWLNKFGEYLSSDSLEDSTSESGEEGIGESDVDSVELVERPPIWILQTGASVYDSEEVVDERDDYSAAQEVEKEEDRVLSKATVDDQQLVSSLIDDTDSQVDWPSNSWKNIDSVVLQAVRAMPGGFSLSPAAFRFLCEQVTAICIAANRAHGKLCSFQEDESQVSTSALPWECTLELCLAMTGVPIGEQTLDKVKCRMNRILSDKKHRKAANERRKLRVLLMSVLHPRYRNNVARLVAMVDVIFEHFGCLQRLFDATLEELATIPGVGPRNLELLHSWKQSLKAKLDDLPDTSSPSQL
ncbi:hypothetical protein Gasu2_59940 [Galdieria sulphuraria]|uniref:Uncharacterized protein n=1 Tax=Galdieria sulphuraria TaxID=130081 RepID=M2WRG6_GALSU|nr:uncharacterized protein Gasu_59570 [Galdieria sulphuraria]EME26395.1 hypothetical protein Gasu_59570 [Galdieria sulphuraria]GJD11870.1 hypothetical protein Gasu2_59940 [Galdieria sulphuraria]|eukprot:XP_005702915.1 hypothetical protein Gasu_59570 [Galdieria sulphuraria]